MSWVYAQVNQTTQKFQTAPTNQFKVFLLLYVSQKSHPPTL